MKDKVFLADLTHTGKGLSDFHYFPLGIGFIASYSLSTMPGEFEFDLFKFPEPMAQQIVENPPKVIALTNYCWNFELSYKLSTWAKRLNPSLVVVFGGPNFPVEREEKKAFLANHPVIDFYIEGEGEEGFANLLKTLREFEFDTEKLKSQVPPVFNCSYLTGDLLIEEGIRRILDVNTIPSPYLNGVLDPFFDANLVPVIETTRGCPFSCAFCADGLPIKNKVARFESDRVRDELSYIQTRLKNVDELMVTDLNFGMYKQDVSTALHLAHLQNNTGWPGIILASAGKNRPERIIEVASLLKGSWVLGSAIQSSDEQVLANVKRGNISQEAYRSLLDFMVDQDNEAMTYTEIILALPGDTKGKHIESLRYGIENNVGNLRMYQAILLPGTEMATEETRDRFGLITKYRVRPGGGGEYKFGDEAVKIVEVEEIIVGSNDMPFDDYLSCRIMDLFVETYVNNGLCDEIFATLRAMKLSVFDFLVFLNERNDLYSPKLNERLESFLSATRDDLYDSYEEAQAFATSPKGFADYESGKLGINELVSHKALLYSDLEDTMQVVTQALKAFLDKSGHLTASVSEYLDELSRFILQKKQAVNETDRNIEDSFRYDFESVNADFYFVDPRYISRTADDTAIRFFHTPAQKEQIQNTIALYGDTEEGVARMIQRHNLKVLYRKFERV